MSSKRATQKDIEYIRETYKKVHSVEKTAEMTGWSIVTVHNYVQDLSSKDARSIHNHRAVLKLEHSSGKVLQKYLDPATAARLTGISESNINHALKGRTKSAGGFLWMYEDEKKARKSGPLRLK